VSEGRDWWRSFFSGHWLYLQGAWWSEEENREQADHVQRLLQLRESARVLDVPCGEGRLALELAARGHHVTAVDVTLPFLEEAKHKAAERGLDVEWVHRDMRRLAWDAEFDAAICWWGSFGYFSDADNARFVEAVAGALKPGGRFLVETLVLETLLPNFQARDWSKSGDTLILEERQWSHDDSRVEAQWTFVRDGVVEKRGSSIRTYSYRELAAVLKSAEFSSTEAFDSQTLEPFRLGASRLAVVATK
jgi:SAM-dependent methyltransferase